LLLDFFFLGARHVNFFKMNSEKLGHVASLSALDSKFLKDAIELGIAQMNAGSGGPFGCLIVKDGKVIGKGFNAVTSSFDPTAHAEVQAIRDACKNLKDFQLSGCTVYTSCEPCPMCLGAIYWARPSRIVFAATREDAAKGGFDDQFLYDELVQPLASRKIPITQGLAREGAQAFEAWIKKSDKILY
jgi:guanine deaminase